MRLQAIDRYPLYYCITRRNQGARRSIFQLPSVSSVYRSLSCSRLLRPCQNSTFSGTTVPAPMIGALRRLLHILCFQLLHFFLQFTPPGDHLALRARYRADAAAYRTGVKIFVAHRSRHL